MGVDAAPRPATTWLAAALALTTAMLLTVMLVVRRADHAAAAAFALGLVTTSVVGAVVASRRPGHPCGWLLLAVAIIAAGSVAATDYVQASLVAEERYPATPGVGWVTTWLAYPAVALGVLVLLTFPSGRLPSRRWRVAAAAIVFASAGAAASSPLMPGPLPIAGMVPNPLGLDGAEGLL